MLFAVSKPGYLLPDGSTALPTVIPAVSRVSLTGLAGAPAAMAEASASPPAPALSVFFLFRNSEQLGEFPLGRNMLGLGQMVLCTAFGHNRMASLAILDTESS